MERFEEAPARPDLRDILANENVDGIKRLLALMPGVQPKVTRKAEIIDTMARGLLGPDLPKLWDRLTALEKVAVTAATHHPDGTYDPEAVRAAHGAVPPMDSGGENSWNRRPTFVRLFLHQVANDGWFVPRDLRQKLLAFVPVPPPSRLASHDKLSALPPRIETTRHFDAGKKDVEYESHEVPLVERSTEQAAIQDLRTTLRLVDQEKIAASDATSLPSKASMSLLRSLLRDGDFFEPSEKANKWDPEIGPIKAFSWPLLIQAAGYAAARNGALVLTKSGRKALEEPPAAVLLDLWKSWLHGGIIDEFSRIDTIKGQKGKGRSGLTPPRNRRVTVADALAECPVGKWVETDEFSRYMRATGRRFEVTDDRWSLYLCDPKYGSLGYEGFGGWNILQERYLLCLLFEYAAPLGIIDVAYEHPTGARPDYTGQWGGDDLIFLSRYDGLKYIRLTPLGAYILGLASNYDPPNVASKAIFSVLPKRQLRLVDGELSPDEILLIEKYADRDGDRLWSLSEAKAIKAVEAGSGIGEFRSFLAASDPQPLPETVESFLVSVEQRGTACRYQGRCVWVPW